MKVAVRYLSKTGNTKKLAEAIASRLHAEVAEISEPIHEPVDILFLGTAVYAAGVDDQVKQFLKENRDQIGTMASFSTAALISGTYRQIQRICDQLEISLCDSEYHCKGKFGPMHTGRPNIADCDAAATWAEGLIQKQD